jgi:hypothetical protein
VTGFVEGEGVFTFSRSGQQLGLYFAVKLPAEDRPLLEQLQQYFAGGSIYEVGARAGLYFRISRRQELDRVIDHFDQYPLRGWKASSFAIWREMVLLKRDSFRKPPREQLDALAVQLSASSSRNAAR